MEKNIQDLVKLLLKNYGIKEEKYSMFLSLIDKSRNDMVILYEINKMIDNDEEAYRNNEEKSYIEIKKMANKYSVESNGDRLVLSKKELKGIVAGIVDICSEVYPLGTVVKIKKEMIDSILDKDTNEPYEVVILDRLVPVSEENYAQYAGSVYPVGNIGKKTPLLYFSRDSIEKVVHMGYSDMEEVEFINDKKRRAICELKLQSLDMKKNKKSVDNVL